MNGIAPLTWATLDGWSRLTGNVPTEDEIDALFVLDALRLNPGELGSD